MVLASLLFLSAFSVIELRPLVNKALEANGQSGQITCPDGFTVDVTFWGMSLQQK